MVSRLDALQVLKEAFDPASQALRVSGGGGGGGGGGMSNPMTSLGDIIVAGSGGFPTRLGVGASGTVLQVVSGTPTWTTITSGETNTGSNVGGGVQLFAQKSGTDLQFRTLVAGGSVSVTQNASTVVISSTGEANSASNLGTGTGLFAGKVGSDLQFKGLKVAGTLQIASDGTSITLTDNGVTASNLGAGTAVLAGKVGTDLQFKTLTAGAGIALGSDGTSVTITSTVTPGDTNSASNVGTGNGVYAGKSGSTLQFKSFVAGSGISIANDANTITITNTGGGGGGGGEANTASNIGSGTGLFAQKNGVDLEFKTITGASGIWVNSFDDYVELSTTAEINTASNLGTGTGLFASKVGPDLQFKSLKTGTGIQLTSDGTSVTITNTVSPGEINTASNIGTGTGLYKQKTGVNLEFKTLKAGGPLQISTDTDSVTFTSTAEANTMSNLGAGVGIYAQKTGVDLQLKSLVAGSGISITSDANTITVANSGSAGMINPMTAQGDLIVGGTSGTPDRLALGASGYRLVSNGTTATWAAPTTYLAPRILDTTWSANMTIDWSQADIVRVVLGGYTTFTFTGAVDGQKCMLELKQDATGSRLINLGTEVAFGSDLTTASLSTGANKTDLLGFIYHSNSTKYRFVAQSRGF